MNKSEAINEFIRTVYMYNSDLIISESDIKKLNNFFKDVMCNEEEFDSFFENNIEQIGMISKLKSGRCELEKQYNKNEALQPGILSECNLIETLAKIFKLNKCLDFDKTPLNSVPIECRNYLNSGYQTFSAARYLYYNPKNPDIFLFQYGNPANGDAEIIIKDNKIRLELKERNAKAGEYDIKGLYDENGKLLISDKFKKETPEYIPLINKFNNETNVIEQIGHNYSKFDEETKVLSILEYFNRHGIDLLVSSTCDNKLVVLTPDCVNISLPNGKKIITTENSEIRTSGRNHTKIFTPVLFSKVLDKMGAKNVGGSEYQVSLENEFVEIVNARGTNVPSRIKFNKLFFVNVKSAKFLDNNMIEFDINNVRQLKPTISMHIKINASKLELKDVFQVY